MSKKFRAITLSCVTVMVCMALLVVGTYALFSDQASISNHLQAGNLEIALIRTAHTNMLLDSVTGTITPDANSTDSERVDFSGKNNSNLFALDDNAKIAPGCSFEAMLLLENNGSVAINWSWELVLSEELESDDALMSQLKVTVSVVEGATETFYISDLLKHVNGGFIAQGGRQAFSIKVEFENLDGSTNNDAQNQNVYFDLIVYAVQAVSTAD